MKYYNYNSWGTQEKICLIKDSYVLNNRLAVTAKTIEHEPFSTLTVCLDYPFSSDDEALAFLDENNMPGITEWLIKKWLR